VAAAKVGPVMVHDSYLINMAHPDPAKREASRQAFLHELERTEQLGIPYLNFHPGSHVHEDKGKRDDRAHRDQCLDNLAAAMAQCIDDTKGYKAKLVIENAAGQGTNVGNSWEEVGFLLDTVGQKKRMGVTIDTQHSWACGYDWVAHYDEVWDAFEDKVGRAHLVAFHLNDSKTECGARVDRHDTIGSGLLGTGFWHTLMNDRKLDTKMGVLETPDGRRSVFVEACGGGPFAAGVERGKETVEQSSGLLGNEIDRALSFLRELFEEAPVEQWHVEVDGRDCSGRYICVEAMNIRFAGPGIPLAPSADSADGLLDVVLIGERHRGQLIDYVDGRLAHNVVELPRLDIVRGAKVRLEPPEGMLRVDDSLQYDVRGAAEITVLKNAVMVLLPG